MITTIAEALLRGPCFVRELWGGALSLYGETVGDVGCTGAGDTSLKGGSRANRDQNSSNPPSRPAERPQ
jgi:hypothetical protein